MRENRGGSAVSVNLASYHPMIKGTDLQPWHIRAYIAWAQWYRNFRYFCFGLWLGMIIGGGLAGYLWHLDKEKLWARAISGEAAAKDADGNKYWIRKGGNM